MDDDLICTILIDPSFLSYQSFFDHEWSRSQTAKTRATKLDSPTLDLMLNWKAAANTHATPFIMVMGVDRFWTAFKRHEEAKAHAPKIIRHVANRLGRRLTLRNMQRKEMQQALAELVAEGAHAEEVAASVTEINIERLWREYTTPGVPGSAEFHLIIYGTQRECFLSLLHTYENFLCEVLRILKEDDSWEAWNFGEISKEMGRLLGPAITAQCVDDRSISAAREVRNALTHKGGQETERTKRLPHGVETVSGKLQIQPKNNRALFDVLRDRATTLVEAALAALEPSAAVEADA